MTIQSSLDTALLRTAIQREYSEVATQPSKGFHFHVGRFLADRLGYPRDRVAALPDSVVESFAGVGNPFFWGDPAMGETVLDMGSGAGFDALLAARAVGPAGRVIGVDMTPAMLNKARANAKLLHFDHAQFREGYLEALPVESGTVDLVISNGVFNLCPDKNAVFAEAFRVLKPGGRIQMSDIVVAKPVPRDAKDDVALWTGCIAGALLEGETRSAITSAGFPSVEFAPRRHDTFSDAPSDSSAAEFGTQGVDFRAIKPR